VFALPSVIELMLPGAGPRVAVRALTVESLRASMIFGLAHEVGDEVGSVRGQPLRRSLELRPSPDYLDLEEYKEPHRRGEILVVAMLTAFIDIWVFTVGDTKLLFPGDAQIENWQYALKLSDRSEQIVKQLETVDVYKVGHHGSRNATPKTLWGTFKKRKKGLRTLMSTKAGKFPGRRGSGTEVPRETLKNALIAETTLTNTQDLSGTKKEFFVDVEVPFR
jgi:hypothetical protein